jgi:hypothetical protein
MLLGLPLVLPLLPFFKSAHSVISCFYQVVNSLTMLVFNLSVRICENANFVPLALYSSGFAKFSSLRKCKNSFFAYLA